MQDRWWAVAEARARKAEPLTLGDRFALGFGGALAGLFTGVLLFLLVNGLMSQLHNTAPELRWQFMPFRWTWWITGFCAVFAFVATESFVRFIGAVWDVLNDFIK